MPNPTTFNLASLDDFRQYAGKQNTGDDGLITRLLLDAERAIYTFLNRPALVSTAFTITINGNGRARISVPYYPLSALTSVTVFNRCTSFPPGYSQPTSIPLAYCTFGSEDDSDSRWIYIIGGGYNFLKGVKNVVIAGTGGYGTGKVPQDIIQSQLEMVLLEYRRKDHIDKQSESLAGMSTSFIQDAMPKSAIAKLSQYRNKIGW